MLLHRVTIINDDTKTIINIVLLMLWCFVEIGRLYTGFYGNLKESVDFILFLVPGNAHFHSDFSHKFGASGGQSIASVERWVFFNRKSNSIGEYYIHSPRIGMGV